MRKFIPLSALLVFGISPSGSALSQDLKPFVRSIPGIGTVEVPISSQRIPAKLGEQPLKPTNTEIVTPQSGVLPHMRYSSTGVPSLDPASVAFFRESPGSLACVYQPPGTMKGCTIALAKGGSKSIAIVDAYDHPNIASDLAAFSSAFGLPSANLQVVYAAGQRPPQDRTGSWEMEEALDVEAAHAMAPGAKIVLVEAASSSGSDLDLAVDVASRLVAAAGGGQVSMSWGSSEWSGETQLDSHFQTPGVTYFASTGDNPGTSYPSTSPYVVAVGGTVIKRGPPTGGATIGAFVEEDAWDQGGGGPSSFYASPSFQQGVKFRSGAKRGVPDIAADASPSSPLLIYNSFPFNGKVVPWQYVGGTSLAAPLVAAMTNASGTFRSSGRAELINLYSNANSAGFRVITHGTCGPNGSYATTAPWSFCTGLGTPLSERPLAISAQ